MKLYKGFLDIETSYALGAYWGGKIWEQDILFTVPKRHSIIMAYTIHWENGWTTTHSLPEYKQFKKDVWDDSGIAEDLAKDFEKAQILIAHNGDNFDIPKVKTRLLFHGYKPYYDFHTIDTKKVAKTFSFPSNKLDDLCEYLDIGRKLRHEGLDMWKKCLTDKPSKERDKAWKMMTRYNRHDVVLLELLYNKFRPYIKNHPNESAIIGMPHGCKNCHGNSFNKRGRRILASGNYKLMYSCNECGAVNYSGIHKGEWGL